LIRIICGKKIRNRMLRKYRIGFVSQNLDLPPPTSPPLQSPRSKARTYNAFCVDCQEPLLLVADDDNFGLWIVVGLSREIGGAMFIRIGIVAVALSCAGCGHYIDAKARNQALQ